MKNHLIFGILFSLAAQACFAASQKPNIIVIMADDLGYGDVSSYGATEIKTPHIDQLASEGLRFTSGYCSASTCTPTRYSFLTGTYAFRREGTGIAPPNGPAIIQPETPTLPGLLQKAGYKTAVIGKWHLGLGTPGEGPDWNGILRPGPLSALTTASSCQPRTTACRRYTSRTTASSTSTPATRSGLAVNRPPPITRRERPTATPSRWIGRTGTTTPSTTASAALAITRVASRHASAIRILPMNG